MNSFDFTVGDYRATFEEAVTKLIESNITSRKARIKAIESLTNRYIDATGERPTPEQLDRLSDYILREELSDKNKAKVTRAIYPFLSEHQLERRYSQQVSMVAAATYGADRRDHRSRKVVAKVEV